MKKIFTILVIAMTIASSALAADFASKKFYINPGHGGHDSDDRPTPMPLSVEIFYESDGNLGRGTALRDFIKANGGSVKMSRTTNTTSDDLALSTIAANSNSYGGYFMSLHTNGANASANYIIAFYRGSSSTNEVVSGSKSMATKVASVHGAVSLSNFTYSTTRAVSDYSFYGYNLGVLRTNTRPGYLVETIFHDYRPEGLRMKSDVYLKYQAWQITSATLADPGGTGTFQGCIIGDIRDLSQSCGYTSYTTRGRDAYLAINSATVNLYNSSGTKVQTMTTDKCCNGVYAFFDLDAGTYSVEVIKSGYATQKKSVTVKNNTATKQCFDLEAGTSTGITVSSSSVEFTDVEVGSSKSKSITVTGTGLSSAISVKSSNSAVTVNSSSLDAAGGTLKITYKPTSAGSTSATVTLTSGSVSTKILVSGTAVNPPLTFTEGWNYSETSGKSPDWLPSAGYSALRNMCFGDGKLYIVNPSGSEIMVVKAQTGELIRRLDMTDVTGGTFTVMDVKYVDGKVLACNLAGTASAAQKVYVWDTDASKPRVLLNTTERNSVSRTGDTFEIDGNLTDGRLIFTYGGSSTSGDTGQVLIYPITSGVVSTTPTVTKATLDDGTDIVMGTSPRAVADSDSRYWIMGQNYQPTLTQEDGKVFASINTTALDDVVAGNDFTRFTYSGTEYALASTYASKANSADGATTLTKGKAVLLDGTNGWANASQVAGYPSAGLGTTRNTNFSTSCCVNVNGTSGVEFWVLVSNQGLAYYKTGTVPTYTYEDPATVTLTSTMANKNFSNVLVGKTSSKSFTVTGTNLSDNVTLSLSGANPEMFKLNKTSITANDAMAGAVSAKVTFAPTELGTYSATLTISTPGVDALTYTLKGNGTRFDAEISDLTNGWLYSETGGNLSSASWFCQDGSQPYSRSITNIGTNLYVLNGLTSNASTITELNGLKGTATTTSISTDGITGGTHYLSSIKAMGSTLFGSNAVKSATGTLKIYRWDTLTSAPVVALSTTDHGDVSVGDQMSVYGTTEDGMFMFSDGSKIVYYTIKSGTINATPTVITLATSLAGINGSSDVIYNGDGTFWVITKDNYPTRIDSDGKAVETLKCLSNKQGSSGVFFDFGINRYFAGASYLNINATTISDGCLDLVDVTDGISSAKLIGSYPSTGLGTTRNTVFNSSVAQALSSNEMTTYIWVLIPKQGIGYYTYNGMTTGVDEIAIPEKNVETMTVHLTRTTLSIEGIDVRQAILYSLSGQAVRIDTSDVMDIEGLHGAYILRAVDAQGRVHAQKLIIR